MADPEKQPEQPKAAQQKQVIGKFHRKYLTSALFGKIEIRLTSGLASEPPSSQRLRRCTCGRIRYIKKMD